MNLFSIRVFMRMRDETKACPLSRWKGDVGPIEWEAEGLDPDGKRSSWVFCPYSGLTWGRLNCDFSVGGGEVDGNKDQGFDRR